MRIYLLAILSFFIQGSLYSQTSVSNLIEYSIQVWSTEEGLPSNNLRHVVQDTKGYIWVSSFNGLMRFDGNTFDIFNSDGIQELKSNGFSKISEDIAGNMYFGTLTSGLLQYNGNAFKLFKIDSSFSKSISAINVDSRGTIWVGTQNNGLYTLDVTTGKYLHIEDDILKNATITCILETDHNAIWFGTANRGVVVYSEGEFKRLLESELQVTCLKQHDGTIYIGSTDGIYSYINEDLDKVESTDGYFVNYFDHDKFGYLWVATETGLIRVAPSGTAEVLTEAEGLPSRQISSLLFDSENNIWLATKRGGLVILRKSNFINISVENGLSNPFVNTIEQLDGGAMAMGSDNGDIDVMTHNQISKMPVDTDLSNISVKDILQDSKGNVWIATYRGVIKKSGNTEELLTTDNGLVSKSPRRLFEDATGNVWIGSKDGGLVKISPDGTRKVYSIENGLSDNYIFSIEQLPNGNILLGTYSGGLNIISKNDEIEVLNFGIDGLSPIIFNVEIVNNDEYWLATDVGLYKYQNQTFYKIDKKDGLRVKTIFDIEIDDYGYLWLTSNLGIVRLMKSEANDFISGQIKAVNARLYDEKDGMLSRECTGATKVFTSKTGNIWIPTSKGISVVDPSNVYVNKKVPPVFIKSILVDGKASSGNLESIILTPGTRRLTIGYTALTYYSPAKINFKYRLRGFEKEWNEVGNLYQATYMNLPDGKFTFEVIAANNDGVWNEIPATVNIRLEPFFYESRLFYLVMVGFSLLVAFIIYWIRIRVVEEKNRELHKLNTELDSFVYSVSHDLRAPLSSILGLIGISKLDKDGTNLPSYLGKIETSVNKLDDFIKEIISYSRNVRLKVEVEEIDLRQLIDEIFEGLAYMNTDDHINVSIESSKKTTIYSDKTRLQVIFNNILSNAFRYYKSYINDSFIKVKISVTNTRAVITVTDNGIGIKPDRLSKIFEMFYRGTDTSNGSGLGLYIAKESVAKLDGAITVESEYERGTTFTVTIDNL
jgi:signal transduction histidine kinase/ligand-binding sensor domain-containing protein